MEHSSQSKAPGDNLRIKLKNNPMNGNDSLENIDVIDLDGLSMDEEDAWLYKLKETPKDSPSPFSWVRQEFECHDLDSQPKSLLNLLNQESKRNVSRQLDYPDSAANLISPGGGEDPVRVCLDDRLLDKSKDAPDDIRDNSKKIKGLVSGAAGDFTFPNAIDLVLDNGQTTPKGQTSPESKGRYEIDTRTFTRPKKTRPGNKTIGPFRFDPEFDEPLPTSVRDETVDQNPDECPTAKKTGSVQRPLADYNRPDESYLKLEDLTDVQVLARMQEENLRSYCSSPLSYTPKTQRRSLSESIGRLSQGVSQSSLSCGSDVSSPNVSRDVPAHVVKSTNSLSSTSSDSSSSRSEGVSNVITTHVKSPRDFGNTHPHSLPNLMKASKFGLPHSLPGDSKLCVSSGQRSLPSSAPDRVKSNGSSTSEKRRLIPEAKITDSSSTSAESDQASIKLKIPATTKSISGIPKPGFTSKLKQPLKWKKNLTTPAQTDGNWKEGCF